MPADSRGRFFYLLEKIVRREGIGDVLADSVSHAAQRIGNGAEAFDHNTTKKFEQLPIKLGKLNPGLLPDDRHRREDEHHPDRGIVSAGPASHPRAAGSFRQQVGSRARREVQEVLPGVGEARRHFRPGHLRDRGLERSHALHRRRHRAVRLRVVVPRPVRRRRCLSHEQHSAGDLARHRHGDRQGPAVEDVPADPHPGAGRERPKRPAPQGRTTARGPLGGARRSATSRNCWAAITPSRAGTTRAFRPGRRWNGWTSAMRPTTWSEEGSCRERRRHDQDRQGNPDRDRQVHGMSRLRDGLLGVSRQAEVQQHQSGEVPHPGGHRRDQRRIRAGARRQLHAHRVRWPALLPAPRQAIQRVQLLPGGLPVQGLLHRARFRPAVEMRHVRRRAGAGAAPVRHRLPAWLPHLRSAPAADRSRRGQ